MEGGEKMVAPVFVRVVDVGEGAYAEDSFGNHYDGVESKSENDDDFLGKCSVCGQKVYIGWRRSGGHLLFCFDCPKHEESRRNQSTVWSV